MARRHRRSSRRKRDFPIIPNRPPRYTRLLPRPRLSVRPGTLLQVEDFRRDYFPIPSAQEYHLVTAEPVRPVRRPSLPGIAWHMPRVLDTLPERAIVCVRRQQRKEVLHALRQTGRSRSYRPKRNRTSNIHCK